MKIIESRNKREGIYSGQSQGKHTRYGSSDGFKRWPLNKRKLRYAWCGEIGKVENFRFITSPYLGENTCK